MTLNKPDIRKVLPIKFFENLGTKLFSNAGDSIFRYSQEYEKTLLYRLKKNYYPHNPIKLVPKNTINLKKLQ